MRDVYEYAQVPDTTEFYRFLRYVALSTGRELNLYSISNELGLGYAVVKKWIGTLDALGVIRLIYPYFCNGLKSLTKTPKLYFTDTGLASYLCGFKSSQDLGKHPIKGAMFETYVVSEIMKSCLNAGEDTGNIYYYRDSEKREIDLVIEDGNKIFPIEIKLNHSPSNATKNMYVLEKAGKDVRPAIVICMSDRLIPCGKNAYYLPVAAL